MEQSNIQDIYLKSEIAIKGLKDELKKKTESLLLFIIKELVNIPINKSTAKRIHCFEFGSAPYKSSYYWDYGKPTEMFLMETHVIFPNNEDPYIQVKAPISIEATF